MTNGRLRIAIGSDHAGFVYKEKIREHLAAKGYSVSDFGTDSEESVDYPHFIKLAADAVASDRCDAGIVLGGSGNGEAMVANKTKGIRCALCWSVESAKLAKEHNDANMVSLGQRLISLETALAIVDAWLGAEFGGGRHQRRLDQIAELEKLSFRG